MESNDKLDNSLDNKKEIKEAIDLLQDIDLTNMLTRIESQKKLHKIYKMLNKLYEK